MIRFFLLLSMCLIQEYQSSKEPSQQIKECSRPYRDGHSRSCWDITREDQYYEQDLDNIDNIF